MSRPMRIEPSWLDALLKRWAANDLRRSSGPLGYPSVCIMFHERVQLDRFESREPWAISGRDYADLQRAIDGLETHHNLAIVRHYKPWLQRDLEALFGVYTYTDRHWRNLVHRAVTELAKALAEKPTALCG